MSATDADPGRRARVAGRAGAVLVGVSTMVGAGLFLTPQATAATPVVTFASIDSIASGCQGARIAGISESSGARYYYRGKRLRFPTKVLRFDHLGMIELTAEPRMGRTITQSRGRVSAPARCFTDITPANEPRYDPVVSWCTTSETPALEQEFQSESLDTVTASWRLTRTSSGKVVAQGTAPIYLGVSPVSFPLPAGLPRGRYVLTVGDAASAEDLFPYSMRAEQYTCLKAPTVKPGKVTFRVPKGGPGVNLTLTTSASPEATVVHVRAGKTYTFRTASSDLYWRAYASGNHVGDLGGGYVEVPQS